MELTKSEIVKEEVMDQDGGEEDQPRGRRQRTAAQVATTALAFNFVTVSRKRRNSSTSPIKALGSSNNGPLSIIKKSSSPIKLSSAMTVDEWCRLANISIEQNTKSRALSGYQDDQGDTSPMYRYGIVQMVKLYCPQGVIRLIST